MPLLPLFHALGVLLLIAGAAHAADHTNDAPPFMERVAPPETGMLILVRHADRNQGETDLNDTGQARAAVLPDALADLPLDAIYHADFLRNADTAAPLASALGLTPQVLEPDETLSTRLVNAAERSAVIWIGNVGNLVDLWEALDLGGASPTRYGSIAILTAQDGRWQVAWRTFEP